MQEIVKIYHLRRNHMAVLEEGDYLNTPAECFWYDAAILPLPVKPHWHYYAELLYIKQGAIEVYIGQEHHILCSGELIIIPPEAVHSIYAHILPDAPRPPFYAVIKFDINRLQLTPHYAPKFRSIFAAAFHKGMPIFFDRGSVIRMDAFSSICKCIQEMENKCYGYDLLIQTELHQLLLKMLRIWMELGFHISADLYVEDTHFDISSVTAYIDEHISQRISVSDIAAACGMSYSYFAKKFLSVYGKTCKEYIEELRLYKVEEFLMFTDFDMNYIAQETGFTDCSHMIKSFKKGREITPKQFRILHKH